MRLNKLFQKFQTTNPEPKSAKKQNQENPTTQTQQIKSPDSETQREGMKTIAIPNGCEILRSGSKETTTYHFPAGAASKVTPDFNTKLSESKQIFNRKEIKEYSNLDLESIISSSATGSILKKPQEDGSNICFSKDGKIAIAVMDGMGKYGDGEKATKHTANAFQKQPFNPKKAIKSALVKMNTDEDINPKAGLVLTANTIERDPDSDKLYLKERHIGDTVTYIYDENNQKVFESKTDSMTQRMIDGGESKDHPAVYNNEYKNIVKKAIRKKNLLEGNATQRKLQSSLSNPQLVELKPGYTVVTMTDGIDDNVHRIELQKMLKQSNGNLETFHDKVSNAVSLQMRKDEVSSLSSQLADNIIDDHKRGADTIHILRQDLERDSLFRDTDPESFDKLTSKINKAINNRKDIIAAPEDVKAKLEKALAEYITPQISELTGESIKDIRKTNFMQNPKADNCAMVMIRV